MTTQHCDLNNWNARNQQLSEAALELQLVTYNDLTLEIDQDVFSPDIGYASRLLADSLATCIGERALDMGTGSLFLALVLRMVGFADVWASDNHPPALECARRNLQRNKALAPITIVDSDLFSNIPTGMKFDLIVFNQPFYPILGPKITGMGEDGGQAISRRFLMDAPAFLEGGGEIRMPYSTIAGPANDPGPIAESMGWVTRTVMRDARHAQESRIYSIQRGQ